MSVKSWNVTYKYKRNSYSSDSKETITIFANSSKDALKDADLKLKNKGNFFGNHLALNKCYYPRKKIF